jgi:hypothetical protein
VSQSDAYCRVLAVLGVVPGHTVDYVRVPAAP